MGEVVNVLVAFAVIIFLFRWVTSTSETSTEQGRAAALGFSPKQVSQEMINTVSNMFPDIPIANIHYDLLRTGNVELTTNKVLERGFLEAPPAAFHTLYPQSSNSGSQPSNGSPTRPIGSSSSSKVASAKTTSLIERYQLEERVKSGEVVEEEKVGGKARWEDSREKREASLRERKAQMILAARQRFLAQQQQAAEKS